MFHDRIVPTIVVAFLGCLLVACGPGEQEDSAQREGTQETTAAGDAAPETPAGEAPSSAGRGFGVEVMGREYAFEAPDSIPGGWTTFSLVNKGSQHHFLLIYRLPDGKTQDDIQNDIVPIYDRVMLALQEGKLDKAGALEELGRTLPEWFFEVEFRGGPGLIAPGGVARTTVNLDQPGLYLMECYVKGPDGRFHSSMGMQKQFTVSGGATGAPPPDADIAMTLSSAGIGVEGELTAGRHTVRVDFSEDPPGGFPYDVHLARLDADSDIEALKQWMDWMNVGGLRAPSPAKFLGGAENMAAGNEAYFTVELSPGRYALLSEVGATEAMYSEFTVD